MWCQNHKQCSKVTWPSPLSFPVNEMRASLSEDGAQVETGRARRRNRNWGPFSDVDTASSVEARSHSFFADTTPLRAIKQDFEGVKAQTSVCDSVIVFPALAVWNFRGDALPNASRRACLCYVPRAFQKKVDTKLLLTGSPLGKKSTADIVHQTLLELMTKALGDVLV